MFGTPSLPLSDPIEEALAPPQSNLDAPFTMFELYRTFRRTKTGRAPGPDNLPMETLCFLHIPSNAFYLHTTMTVSLQAQLQTTGS